MDPLFLCVPNFSHGPDPSFLADLRAIITAEADAELLGLEGDTDHARCVLSFAGTHGAVLRCLRQLARLAIERIDLNQHRGCHPRIGALDVAPIIPLLGTPVAAALRLADQVGRAFARLGLPVFFYGQASRREGRRVPAPFRKGGFETLRRSIGTSPRRTPDLGPAAVHERAGAVAVGVRPPLIALNFQLAAPIEQARELARELRQAGVVQSLGFPLPSRGLVQVSCNLLDHLRCGPREVTDALLAAGVAIHSIELVGLVPAEAAARMLGLSIDFSPPWHDRILEHRLERFLARIHGPDTFVRRLADPDDAPGGGSAAALVASLSCGLLQLVVGHSRKKRYAALQTAAASAGLVPLAAQLADTRRLDADAWAAVLEAYRRPKTDPEKAPAIERALLEAARVPADLAATLGRLLPAIELCTQHGNPNLLPDSRAAGLLAEAAAQVAALQMRDNLRHLHQNADDLQAPAREALQALTAWRARLLQPQPSESPE